MMAPAVFLAFLVTMGATPEIWEVLSNCELLMNCLSLKGTFSPEVNITVANKPKMLAIWAKDKWPPRLTKHAHDVLMLRVFRNQPSTASEAAKLLAAASNAYLGKGCRRLLDRGFNFAAHHQTSFQ